MKSRPPFWRRRDVGAGLGGEAGGEIGPEFAGAAGPVGVGGHIGALGLDPDQAEIAAGGAVGDVALSR
jgi:hypothetical protein